MRYISVIVLLGILALPLASEARIGVGVGLGKINITEPLRSGGIYTLPALPVLNTGDEAGRYEVTIEYFQDQPEKEPPEEWFNFSPQSFEIEPGGVKNVAVTLTLPLKTEPGKYFAFVEAHPIKKEETAGASIGIAAASKLTFEIAPANIFQAAAYRIGSFFSTNSPWSWVVLAVAAAAVVVLLFRRFFNFQLALGVKRKKDN